MRHHLMCMGWCRMVVQRDKHGIRVEPADSNCDASSSSPWFIAPAVFVVLFAAIIVIVSIAAFGYVAVASRLLLLLSFARLLLLGCWCSIVASRLLQLPRDSVAATCHRTSVPAGAVLRWRPSPIPNWSPMTG